MQGAVGLACRGTTLCTQDTGPHAALDAAAITSGSRPEMHVGTRYALDAYAWQVGHPFRYSRTTGRTKLACGESRRTRGAVLRRPRVPRTAYGMFECVVQSLQSTYPPSQGPATIYIEHDSIAARIRYIQGLQSCTAVFHLYLLLCTLEGDGRSTSI